MLLNALKLRVGLCGIRVITLSDSLLLMQSGGGGGFGSQAALISQPIPPSPNTVSLDRAGWLAGWPLLASLERSPTYYVLAGPLALLPRSVAVLSLRYSIYTCTSSSSTT